VECTKVLIVDQEQAPYETLKPALMKHGYEIHTTTAIQQACRLASAHHYKVALISLPLASETSLLAGLYAELPDLPVILVLPPTNIEHLSGQVFKAATNSIGKPLAFEPVRLMLDRTLELTSLRSQIRQHRQPWNDILPRSCATAAQQGEPASAPTSFEALLMSKLRLMFPGLEALGRGTLHALVLSHVEKLLLTFVLNECRGNQLRSAKILGINRNTLRKKIGDLHISVSRGGA
jgi:DNA-binding NtrC family response regulator